LIRPFRLGDIFLIQRLSRQSTRLSLIRTLLYPQSPAWAAIKTVNPLNDAKVTTYVLKQQGHQLARAGFIQIQKRPERPEADIILLSPALDTPTGHPAIWEKLLAYAMQEAARQQIVRLFVEVPDQPLPVNTFAHVGFKLYKHQTVWRMPATTHIPGRSEEGYQLRPARAEDQWALEQLYAAVTPIDVRRAEGLGPGEDGRAQILDGCGISPCQRYVLDEGGDITGCVHLMPGRRGTWLRVWTDTLQPDNWRIHALLRFAVNTAHDASMPAPVYIGVNDYHGGLRSVLSEYGFAPFSDRANMVKPVLAWVRDAVPVAANVVEPVGEIIPTPFLPPRVPEPAGERQLGHSLAEPGAGLSLPGWLPRIHPQPVGGSRTSQSLHSHSGGHSSSLPSVESDDEIAPGFTSLLRSSDVFDHTVYFGHSRAIFRTQGHSRAIFRTQGEDVSCA
jgi:hypothetical protein